tara:strand:- start:2175 stop:2552 length:378 start_codon:yes stop_codon:yes gene_type:complete
MSRKLKPLSERKPDEMVKMNQFAKEISKRTGYTVKDVTEVWRAGIDIIIEYLKDGKSMVLPKIGMLFSVIKPSRKVTNMNGGVGCMEAMTMPARWVIRFRPGIFIKNELMKRSPTKSQIDNLYED